MKKILILLGSFVLLQGCAHEALEKDIDSKVSKETTVNTRSDLTAETNEIIEKNPKLTTAQKVALTDLRDSTNTQMQSLRQNSLKLRSVLLKDIVSSNYNESEAEVVKDRIRDNEEKQISLFFASVREANRILGHWGSVNERSQFYEMLNFH